LVAWHGRLFASTWNVGGVVPPDDLDLSDWLDGGDDGPYDMYVLGFQEVVPLRARNVLGADKKRVGMRWIELIRATLNRSHSQRQRGGGSSGTTSWRCTRCGTAVAASWPGTTGAW
jgi:hypothetical protein